MIKKKKKDKVVCFCSLKLGLKFFCFAAKAISALDLSWPLIAPCWPHTLTTLPSRDGCAEFTKESQETVPETGCLQGTSAPETWNTRLWYWQQGLCAGPNQPTGKQVWIRYAARGINTWSTCLVYVLCRHQNLCWIVLLSGDSHRFKEWI